MVLYTSFFGCLCAICLRDGITHVVCMQYLLYWVFVHCWCVCNCVCERRCCVLCCDPYVCRCVYVYVICAVSDICSWEVTAIGCGVCVERLCASRCQCVCGGSICGGCIFLWL